MKFFKIIKIIILSPIFFAALLIYKLDKNRKVIDADMIRLGYTGSFGLTNLLLSNKEFRNIFYFRIGFPGIFLNIFLKENPTLHIMTKQIGEGLIVVHGDATFINAKSIGRNCYVNQSVTIGVIGHDAPLVGNDVRIATGAIVLGKINIGDNVIIGAGSVVTKNVPSNCTVVGNPSRIVKKDGVRVNINL